MAGLLSWRYPPQGLTALALIAAMALPASGGALLTRETGRRAVLFLLFFLGGFILAARTDVPPLAPGDIPEWLERASTPKGKEKTHPSFSEGVPLAGTITETEYLDGGRIRLLLEDVTATGESLPLPGRLVLTWQNPPESLIAAGPGTRLSATLRLRRIRSLANPGTWETETYWRDQNAFFRSWSQEDGSRRGKAPPLALSGKSSVSWKARESLRAKTVLALATDPRAETVTLSQPAAVILAMLFGDRSYCDRAVLDLVSKATLVHSLALSGMHLGYAAAAGYFAVWLLGRVYPAAFLRLPRQKLSILLALPLSTAYLWLGAAPPSLARAGIMLLLCAVLLWRNKPNILMDGLILAVALILLFSPASLYDIRLQLSAASIAAMALAAPFMTRLRHAMRRWPRVFFAAAGMAVISVATQAAVLPIVVDAFPGTGVWFPLNIIWLPVLAVWVMPASFAGLFCAGAGFAKTAAVLFILAEWPCEALIRLLQWMEASGILAAPVLPRPPWPVAAGYWLLLLLVPAFAMRKNFCKNAALSVLALGLITVPVIRIYADSHEELVRLTAIDVGQGQGVLISWQGKENGRALIDGGGFARSAFDVGRQIVTPVLTASALPRLDWIINSHSDADHLQGLLFPLETFAVRHVGFPPEYGQKITAVTQRRDAALARRGFAPHILRAGDTIPLAGELFLEVLHPGTELRRDNNNNALVVRLVRGGKTLALLCGDIGRIAMREVMAKNPGIGADVLVLPHHGSASSFLPPFYDAVKPKLAIASCGYANSWHFPADAVRNALRERNIPLLTTAEKGQIVITWKGEEMTVRTARNEDQPD